MFAARSSQLCGNITLFLNKNLSLLTLISKLTIKVTFLKILSPIVNWVLCPVGQVFTQGGLCAAPNVYEVKIWKKSILMT